MTALIVLIVASMWVETQNALAGGSSYVTLHSAWTRPATITSTVALFPAQLVIGFTGRRGGPAGLASPR
jgi:hypothetical protein